MPFAGAPGAWRASVGFAVEAKTRDRYRDDVRERGVRTRVHLDELIPVRVGPRMKNVAV
jgi:hypothetical protein